MSETLSLADVNRLMGENFRATSRYLVRLCRVTEQDSGDFRRVRELLPFVCGCHNRTRALLGRLLAILDVPDPCCYPGPLEGRLPCGVKYPAPPKPIHPEDLIHARRTAPDA